MTQKSGSFLTSFTFWSLLALVSGLALGVWGVSSESPAIHALSLLVRPFAVLWLSRALQLVVISLIVFQLLTVLTGGGNGGRLGRTGGRAFAGIALFSAAVLLVSLLLAIPVVRLNDASPETVEAIRGSVSLEAIEGIGSTETPTPGEWHRAVRGRHRLVPKRPPEGGIR